MSAAIVATGHAQDGQALIDAHSPAHLAVGLAAGALGVDPHVAALAFIGTKILSRALTKGASSAVFGREYAESLGNELADISLEVLGVFLGKRIREHQLAQQAAATTAGVGAYYAPQPYIPISGLGAYYQDPVYVPIR